LKGNPVQIELLKPHEHAGARCSAGAVLAIDDTQGQWLIDLAVARRVSPSSSAKPGKPNSSSAPLNQLSLNQPSKPTEEISK
jgi:hypothetical protein